MAGDDSLGLARSQRQTAADIVWNGSLAALGVADAAARLAARLDETAAWLDVLAEARRLRLAPLLYLGLHACLTLRATIPPHVWEALRRSACAAAARTTHLERVCADVVAGATTSGIPILVLKGPALGSLVYPSVAARPMDDVDLLVAAADRERLAAILRGLGYRNDLRGEEDFLDTKCSHSVDLHSALVNTTRLPARGALWPVGFDDLWARSQPCVLAGVPVRTLGPHDTLLYLAVHAVHHHGMTGALWMIDLLACLRAWPSALDGVVSAPPPVRRSLWYCLEVLAAVGQDPVPGVRRAIRPHRVFPGENWVLSAIGHGDLPEAFRYGLTLVCLPRWRAKLSFLRQLFLPRAGVHTEGFRDGGGSVPGWGEHWREGIRLSRRSLRAALAGCGTGGHGPASPD